MTKKENLLIAVIVTLYAVFWIIVGISRLETFSFFNPKDFATYNQTFWNTLHGRWFQNTTYGSNFACHNAPFYFLLLPFYALFPTAATLIVLRDILLALSVIPFYAIVREIFPNPNEKPSAISHLLLIFIYLFNPYIAGINLMPPHEPTFAPFFIFSTYYFFRTRQFTLSPSPRTVVLASKCFLGGPGRPLTVCRFCFPGSFTRHEGKGISRD